MNVFRYLLFLSVLFVGVQNLSPADRSAETVRPNLEGIFEACRPLVEEKDLSGVLLLMSERGVVRDTILDLFGDLLSPQALSQDNWNVSMRILQRQALDFSGTSLSNELLGIVEEPVRAGAGAGQAGTPLELELDIAGIEADAKGVPSRDRQEAQLFQTEAKLRWPYQVYRQIMFHFDSVPYPTGDLEQALQEILSQNPIEPAAGRIQPQVARMFTPEPPKSYSMDATYNFIDKIQKGAFNDFDTLNSYSKKRVEQLTQFQKRAGSQRSPYFSLDALDLNNSVYLNNLYKSLGQLYVRLEGAREPSAEDASLREVLARIVGSIPEPAEKTRISSSIQKTLPSVYLTMGQMVEIEDFRTSYTPLTILSDRLARARRMASIKWWLDRGYTAKNDLSNFLSDVLYCVNNGGLLHEFSQALPAVVAELCKGDFREHPHVVNQNLYSLFEVYCESSRAFSEFTKEDPAVIAAREGLANYKKYIIRQRALACLAFIDGGEARRKDEAAQRQLMREREAARARFMDEETQKTALRHKASELIDENRRAIESLCHLFHQYWGIIKVEPSPSPVVEEAIAALNNGKERLLSSLASLQESLATSPARRRLSREVSEEPAGLSIEQLEGINGELEGLKKDIPRQLNAIFIEHTPKIIDVVYDESIKTLSQMVASHGESLEAFSLRFMGDREPSPEIRRLIDNAKRSMEQVVQAQTQDGVTASDTLLSLQFNAKRMLGSEAVALDGFISFITKPPFWSQVEALFNNASTEIYTIFTQCSSDIGTESSKQIQRLQQEAQEREDAAEQARLQEAQRKADALAERMRIFKTHARKLGALEHAKKRALAFIQQVSYQVVYSKKTEFLKQLTQDARTLELAPGQGELPVLQLAGDSLNEVLMSFGALVFQVANDIAKAESVEKINSFKRSIAEAKQAKVGELQTICNDYASQIRRLIQEQQSAQAAQAAAVRERLLGKRVVKKLRANVDQKKANRAAQESQAAVKIQSFARMNKAKNTLTEMRAEKERNDAALLIEKTWRGSQGRKMAQDRRDKLKRGVGAVVALQRSFRANQAQKAAGMKDLQDIYDKAFGKDQEKGSIHMIIDAWNEKLVGQRDAMRGIYDPPFTKALQIVNGLLASARDTKKPNFKEIAAQMVAAINECEQAINDGARALQAQLEEQSKELSALAEKINLNRLKNAFDKIFSTLKGIVDFDHVVGTKFGDLDFLKKSFAISLSSFEKKATELLNGKQKLLDEFKRKILAKENAHDSTNLQGQALELISSLEREFFTEIKLPRIVESLVQNRIIFTEKYLTAMQKQAVQEREDMKEDKDADFFKKFCDTFEEYSEEFASVLLEKKEGINQFADNLSALISVDLNVDKLTAWQSDLDAYCAKIIPQLKMLESLVVILPEVWKQLERWQSLVDEGIEIEDVNSVESVLKSIFNQLVDACISNRSPIEIDYNSSLFEKLQQQRALGDVQAEDERQKALDQNEITLDRKVIKAEFAKRSGNPARLIASASSSEPVQKLSRRPQHVVTAQGYQPSLKRLAQESTVGRIQLKKPARAKAHEKDLFRLQRAEAHERLKALSESPLSLKGLSEIEGEEPRFEIEISKTKREELGRRIDHAVAIGKDRRDAVSLAKQKITDLEKEIKSLIEKIRLLNRQDDVRLGRSRDGGDRQSVLLQASQTNAQSLVKAVSMSKNLTELTSTGDKLMKIRDQLAKRRDELLAAERAWQAEIEAKNLEEALELNRMRDEIRKISLNRFSEIEGYDEQFGADTVAQKRVAFDELISALIEGLATAQRKDLEGRVKRKNELEREIAAFVDDKRLEMAERAEIDREAKLELQSQLARKMQEINEFILRKSSEKEADFYIAALLNQWKNLYLMPVVNSLITEVELGEDKQSQAIISTIVSKEPALDLAQGHAKFSLKELQKLAGKYDVFFADLQEAYNRTPIDKVAFFKGLSSSSRPKSFVRAMRELDLIHSVQESSMLRVVRELNILFNLKLGNDVVFEKLAQLSTGSQDPKPAKVKEILDLLAHLESLAALETARKIFSGEFVIGETKIKVPELLVGLLKLFITKFDDRATFSILDRDDVIREKAKAIFGEEVFSFLMRLSTDDNGLVVGRYKPKALSLELFSSIKAVDKVSFKNGFAVPKVEGSEEALTVESVTPSQAGPVLAPDQASAATPAKSVGVSAALEALRNRSTAKPPVTQAGAKTAPKWAKPSGSSAVSTGAAKLSGAPVVAKSTDVATPVAVTAAAAPVVVVADGAGTGEARATSPVGSSTGGDSAPKSGFELSADERIVVEALAGFNSAATAFKDQSANLKLLQALFKIGSDQRKALDRLPGVSNAGIRTSLGGPVIAYVNKIQTNKFSSAKAPGQAKTELDGFMKLKQLLVDPAADV